MSEIDIRRTHALAPDAARRLAERVARRLGRQFRLRYHWDGDVLRFQHDGARGTLTVRPEELHLHAHLGFMLSLARPVIEREIHAQLDQALSPEAKPDHPPAA